MSLFDTGIIPAINNYIQSEADKKRDYGDYWSASRAGYCYRLCIFERLQVPHVNQDPRKQRVFSAGDVFHKWLQDITKEAGLSIAQELELQNEELMVRGHIDDLVLIVPELPDPVHTAVALVKESPDNKLKQELAKAIPMPRLILYDYKTQHSKWFEYVKHKPMSYYHRHQLGTYMYMLRTGDWRAFGGNDRIYTPDISEARRLAISKDDLRLYEHQLLWSPELNTDVLDYWNGLNQAWDDYNQNTILPACTCHLHEINTKLGIGFMATPDWNPYFYDGEPCSIKYFNKWKELNGPIKTT